MNGSDKKDAEQPRQSLRERIQDAHERALSDDQSSLDAIRRDFLRLILCWLDDQDGQARADGHEKGCSDDNILHFLQDLRTQKSQTREIHLSEAKFLEAHADLQEIRIIDEFLPQQLKPQELDGEAKAIVEKLGAKKLKDMPACVDALEKRFPGQIDPKLAGKAVRDALG